MPGGAIQVDFDGVALAQAIVAAGASLWDSNRPFTLVAINPVPSGPAGDALRVQLEQTAEERGLPISLVPLAVTDAAGADAAGRCAVLQSAQSLGGDAVLIGRADPANPGQWQWHLVSGYTSEGWTGALRCRRQRRGGLAGQRRGGYRVEAPGAGVVAGRRTSQRSNDYARVEQLLRAVPGVQSSGLTAAQGTTATFAVGVRGGGTALSRALAGSAHLAGTGSGETQVQLNYMP